MPFDWKAPIGYIAAFMFQYIGTRYLYLFGTAIISFEIACYLVVLTFIKDIKHEVMRAFNELAKSTRKNQSQQFNQLVDSIEFHTHVKQLSEAALH